MIIEAKGDEFFNFKLEEATLNKILEFKNITINGTWGNKSKKFSCVINSITPLRGKLSEIYKYNISGRRLMIGAIIGNPNLNMTEIFYILHQ